jgi:hypothetical protein
MAWVRSELPRYGIFEIGSDLCHGVTVDKIAACAEVQLS